MIECVCNNIRTKHVNDVLVAPPEKTTPGQIYKAAALLAGADQPKMKCANCSCRFDEIAASHNADKGLAKIKKTLEPVPSTETLVESDKIHA